MLKKIFSGSVNDQIGNLSDILLFHPTAPYWYLYALFFIFLVTPTFSSVKSAACGLIIAVVARIVNFQEGCNIYAVSTVLTSEIWFVFGMSICVYGIQLNGKRKIGEICGGLFLVLSVVVYAADIHKSMIPFF